MRLLDLFITNLIFAQINKVFLYILGFLIDTLFLCESKNKFIDNF